MTLFERFTRSTRLAVQRAARIAERYGAPAIRSEHLLLALVEAGDTCARPWARTSERLTPQAVAGAIEQESDDARALETLGISLAEVRRAVEDAFGPGAWEESGRPSRVRFSREAKDALELTLREAVGLRHRRLLPQHLWLALVRQRGGAYRVMVELGVDPEELRSGILATMALPGLAHETR